MPFPLAHPAAVLPLKRYCPRYLSFGALVVGSIAPDVGYCFTRYGCDALAHRFVGSFLFDLPVGALMLAALFVIRRPFVAGLPERVRQLYDPLLERRIGPLLAVAVSILIGAWTHQIWDVFTHSHSWIVEHSPLLRTRVAVIHGKIFEICHIIWFGSSFVGVAMLCFAYEQWLAANHATSMSRAASIRNAVLIGLFVLPIEMIHYIFNTLAGFAVTGFCTFLLVMFVVLTFGNSPRNQTAS